MPKNLTAIIFSAALHVAAGIVRQGHDSRAAASVESDGSVNNLGFEDTAQGGAIVPSLVASGMSAELGDGINRMKQDLLKLTAGKVTPQVVEAAAEIKTLTVEMRGHIQNGHDADLGTLTGLLDKFGNLAADFTQGQTDAEADKAIFLQKNLTHMACRQSELEKFDKHEECKVELAALLADMNTKDTILQAIAKDALDVSAHETSVEPPPDVNVSDNTDTTVAVYLDGLDTKFEGFCTEYTEKEEAFNASEILHKAKVGDCEGTKTMLEDKNAACDVIQGQMEQAACSYAQTKSNLCEGYQVGYEATAQDYDAASTTAITSSKCRKMEIVQIDIIDCLLATISNPINGSVDHDVIAECPNSFANVDYTKWDIVPEAKPLKLTCPDDLAYTP